ncbi:hypothetical protein [Bradyrhizobium sp. LB13.1]
MFVVWLVVAAAPLALAQSDPLPSWNDGAVKKVHYRFRHARDDARRRRLVPSSSASRLSTMTARSGPLDEATAQRCRPAATGDAAIYTEHVKLAHTIRKVLLRQIAITNYVNPF